MINLTIYLFLALGVSILCSVLEAVLLSVPRAHVATMVRQGTRAGIWLEQMKQNIDRPLAAILTLNTVAHTVGAAGVGAQAQRVFGEAWVTGISTVLTLLILVLSEIIPKTLGAVYCKPLASPATTIIQVLIVVSYPFVKLSEAISRIITSRAGSESVSRDEVGSMAEIGLTEGTLLARESHIIRNLLHMEKVRISEIMTPRSVVFMMPGHTTIREAINPLQPLRFARVPLYGSNQDEITGMVHRHDILEVVRRGLTDKTLQELAAPMQAIPELATVTNCLEQFLQRQEQMFLVVDEYGGTAGVVTLEDVLETLLGVEIVDETDITPDMREYARQRANDIKEPGILK